MSGSVGQRFDSVAEAYDQSRPGYPIALVERLDPPGDALEIGCGSGQLTVDLLRRGHRVLAIDIGTNLLELARRRCATANFVNDSFEDIDLDERQFDLVASATAFHWVDPHIGYEKAARYLRPEGRLALLSHRVVLGPHSHRFDEVAARCAPSFPLGLLDTTEALIDRVRAAGTEDISSVHAAIEGRSWLRVDAHRWFGPCSVKWVQWDQSLTAPELLRTLAGTSSWPLMPAHEIRALGDGIGAMVAALGGAFTRRRVTFLALAPRRAFSPSARSRRDPQ